MIVIKVFIPNSNMATSGVFAECYIYREFIDSETYLLTIVDYKNKMIYHKCLTKVEWEKIMPLLTLNELEDIFQACISKKNGYGLSIAPHDNILELNFRCQKLDDKSQWQIACIKISARDKQKIKDIYERIYLDVCRKYGEQNYIRKNIFDTVDPDDDDESSVSDQEDKNDDSNEKRKPQVPFQSFFAAELKRQKEKNPGLPSTEYMRLAAIEWKKQKELIS